MAKKPERNAAGVELEPAAVVRHGGHEEGGGVLLEIDVHARVRVSVHGESVDMSRPQARRLLMALQWLHESGDLH